MDSDICIGYPRKTPQLGDDTPLPNVVCFLIVFLCFNTPLPPTIFYTPIPKFKFLEITLEMEINGNKWISFCDFHVETIS